MIIGDILRKLFGIEKPECPKCDLYRDVLMTERQEKGEYYNRLMVVLRVSNEPSSEAVNIPGNFKPVGGIVDWRRRQSELSKASQSTVGDKVKGEWEEQIKKVEETLDSVQSRGEAKANQ